MGRRTGNPVYEVDGQLVADITTAVSGDETGLPGVPTRGLNATTVASKLSQPSTRIRQMALAPVNVQAVIASPPAVTLSASLLNAGQTKVVASTSGVFADNCPIIQNSGTLYQSQGILAADGSRANGWGQGWERAFDFDGQYFSTRIISYATSQYIRIWVNEQAITADLVRVDSLTGYLGTGQISYLNIDFGSRSVVPRRIMIELEDSTNITVRGDTRIDPRDTISYPNTPSRRLMVCGDSYAVGVGGQIYSHSYAKQMGRALGVRDTWNWGSIAGTGLVKTNGAQGAYFSRLADFTARSPDILVVQGSINDNTYVGQNLIGPALTTFVGAVKAALPGCLVVVTSPLYVATPSAAYLTNRDELQATALALGVLFVDMLDQTQPLFVGTGSIGGPTGDGNADYYRAADNTHPTDAGHSFLGIAVARGVARVLGIGI